MFKLDNAFLEELGLGTLPAIEKNKMLAHIYETLEMRVGVRLAEQMSSDQLDEFESYINRKDEAGALKWLESNFPDYKQVVAEELDKLKSEISKVAPQIVAQAQQAAASSVPPQAPTSSNDQPHPTSPQPQTAQIVQAKSEDTSSPDNQQTPQPSTNTQRQHPSQNTDHQVIDRQPQDVDDSHVQENHYQPPETPVEPYQPPSQ